MAGDGALFTREDAVEAAWRWVMPVLDRWAERNDVELTTYAAGTWGPREADRLLHAVDVGGERRDQDASLPERNDLPERIADEALRRVAEDLGGVAVRADVSKPGDWHAVALELDHVS